MLLLPDLDLGCGGFGNDLYYLYGNIAIAIYTGGTTCDFFLGGGGDRLKAVFFSLGTK